jgi:hypothetical protein
MLVPADKVRAACLHTKCSDEVLLDRYVDLKLNRVTWLVMLSRRGLLKACRHQCKGNITCLGHDNVGTPHGTTFAIFS